MMETQGRRRVRRLASPAPTAAPRDDWGLGTAAAPDRRRHDPANRSS